MRDFITVTDSAIDPESVDVLLFDLGGVVIKIDFGRCFARWAESLRCDPDGISARFAIDAAYKEHEQGTLDAAGYFATLRQTLELDLCDDDLLKGWNDIYVDSIAEMVPVLAAASARFPLYAFTNTNPSHQAVWSARFAPELEVFTRTFVSSELGLRKPDRRAYEAVARAIGVPEPTILFFDDSPENVAGARDAGLQAVHVTSTGAVRSALRVIGVEVPASVREDRR